MNEAESAVKGVLTSIVRSLVDRPDDVVIQLMAEEGGSRLKIYTHIADAGRLIGEHGRTVHAIRVVINAIAAKRGGSRFNIEIMQPPGSTESGTV